MRSKTILGQLLLVSTLLFAAGCSEREPTPPSTDTLRSALEEPILNQLSYRGFNFPREAVRMQAMDVIVTSFNAAEGVELVGTTGSFIVELTADGGDIQLMIMGDGGDLTKLMAAQPFVRAGGNLLRKGQQIQYSFQADLVKTPEGEWRIARGQTQAR